MADNVSLPASAVTTRTDDIGGIHWQGVKIAVGDDGTAVFVSATAPLPITPQRLATATLSNVAASATSVTVLAANTARQGAYVLNDSTALCYLKFGSAASSTSHTVQLDAGALYELPSPVYSGILTGIWVSATGSARVTELVV